jgi:hypothetical protein
MKIKLDENLPRSLVSTLTAVGHDVDTFPTSTSPEKRIRLFGKLRKMRLDF